jgi:hypothetical protein
MDRSRLKGTRQAGLPLEMKGPTVTQNNSRPGHPGHLSGQVRQAGKRSSGHPRIETSATVIHFQEPTVRRQRRAVNPSQMPGFLHPTPTPFR